MGDYKDLLLALMQPLDELLAREAWRTIKVMLSQIPLSFSLPLRFFRPLLCSTYVPSPPSPSPVLLIDLSLCRVLKCVRAWAQTTRR